MSLEQRTIDRIRDEFPEADGPDAVSWLQTYAGPERDRVIWNILTLSKGDVKKVRHYVENAKKDYRDILYWAEYYDDDPMVKGRDPKKLTDEILKKFGKRKD